MTRSKVGALPRHAFVPTTALAQSVTYTDDTMQVELTYGRMFCVPLAWFPTLHHATPEQRMRVRIGGDGRG